MSIQTETIATIAKTFEITDAKAARRFKKGSCMQCGHIDANNPHLINTLVYYLCDECELLDATDDVEQFD